MMKKKAEVTQTIEIIEMKRGVASYCLVGTRPLIMNRMSAKAMQQLLSPGPRKNAAERQGTLKHNPLSEFQAAAHRMRDPASKTLLAMPALCFKNALREAALDMPGANKTQIGRLTYVNEEMIEVFGLPQLMISVTRCADAKKTPDMRTRVILPHWCCRIDINFVEPLLNAKAITHLLNTAGFTMGIGDWRPQKGSGNYGQFRIASRDDSELLKIESMGARQQQIAAMEDPQPYDQETETLLDWFRADAAGRGFNVELAWEGSEGEDEEEGQE